MEVADLSLEVGAVAPVVVEVELLGASRGGARHLVGFQPPVVDVGSPSELRGGIKALPVLRHVHRLQELLRDLESGEALFQFLKRVAPVLPDHIDRVA